MREFKTFAAPDAMKAEVEGRTLIGYFATWDIDRVRDIIVPGAFKKTFAERGPIRSGERVRSKIKVGFNHKEIIGIPLRLWEDSKGAGYEAKIDQTPVGDLVLARARSGSLDSNSFTYDVLDFHYDATKKIRYLKELRVYELGPVDQPCNEAADITGVKRALVATAPDRQRLLQGLKALRGDIEALNAELREKNPSHRILRGLKDIRAQG